MTKTTKIDVNSIQQLIDLNGEMTNFKITFNVKSEDGSEFNAVVIDQHTLDTNSTPEFKITKNGELSGTIIADKNVFQNYYLALKSEKPITCTLNIDIEEIPPRALENLIPEPEKSFFSNWPLILLIASIICVAGYFIYTFYFSKPTHIIPESAMIENAVPESIMPEIITPTILPVTEEILLPPATIYKQPSSSTSSIKSSASAYNVNNIMSRLNKLSI